MRDVVFIPEAEEDLASILRYGASPKATSAFVSSLRAYCESLSEFPVRGTGRSDILPGLRLLGFRRRATIAFVVQADRVVVLAVSYAGRDVAATLEQRIG